ncbi:3-hydroxyacyl-CoA dehydrogenase family protein [Nocardiopsis salina]|uniref:3-hydroxyacyl-CoA dehydrogenase family protein n=1 Tax=Nocardiopsis salina TaxID=245836 RepID=UPI0003482043|nr:3-hydroxyacyl-CoA dehydrogenase family protein [Nocardiopsis salina]
MQDTDAAPLRVAVVGTGYMGGGIAHTFALAGHRVTVADAGPERAREAVDRLLEEGRRYAQEGLFPSHAPDRLARNLEAAPDPAGAVRDAHLVCEAVPEDAALKSEVLAQLSRQAPPTALIASNTSAVPIADLARSVQGPERFLGAHWMNPAYFVPCVEVVPGPATAAQTVESTAALLRSVGKSPTVVADSPGFVANRLQFALYKECTRMVEEGVADPAQIDEVVRNSFGFRLPFFGPFLVSDIAGLDVYRGAMATMEEAFGARMGVPEAVSERVDRGRLGLKSGEGFFPHAGPDADRLRRLRDHAYARLARLREDVERDHT